jgi:hypothetical protein
MEIVSVTGDSNIKVVPRKSKAYITIIYTNVQTDASINTGNISPVFLKNHLEFTFSDTNKTDLKIKESQFVHFEIYGADTLEGNAVDLMYRGRIFITDQTINQIVDDVYNINEGDYTEQQSDNEFIIY